MYRHLLLSLRSKESQVWIRPSDMSLAASVQIWSNSEAVPARLHWLYSFHCKRLVLVWGQPFYVKVSEIAEISTYCADSSWLTFWLVDFKHVQLFAMLDLRHTQFGIPLIAFQMWASLHAARCHCEEARWTLSWRNSLWHMIRRGMPSTIFGPTTESGHFLQVYQRYHHLALLFSWIPIYCTVGEQTCRPLWEEAGEGSFT